MKASSYAMDTDWLIRGGLWKTKVKIQHLEHVVSVITPKIDKLCTQYDDLIDDVMEDVL